VKDVFTQQLRVEEEDVIRSGRPGVERGRKKNGSKRGKTPESLYSHTWTRGEGLLKERRNLANLSNRNNTTRLRGVLPEKAHYGKGQHKHPPLRTPLAVWGMGGKKRADRLREKNPSESHTNQKKWSGKRSCRNLLGEGGGGGGGGGGWVLGSGRIGTEKEAQKKETERGKPPVSPKISEEEGDRNRPRNKGQPLPK